MLYNTEQVNPLKNLLKPRLMFVTSISGEDHAIDILNRKNLPKIYKSFPFVFNAKKHFLWDYVKIKELEGLIEVTFLSFLTPKERCIAFLLLSTLLSKYNLGLRGLGISIDVSPKLKKNFGETCVERVLLPYQTNIWNFDPEKPSVVMDVPGALCEKIHLLETGEEKRYSSDYFTASIRTSKIHSLILL